MNIENWCACEGTFFLGTPVPSLRLAYRLSNLDTFYSDTECDFGNSSFPHVTILSPRALPSVSCAKEIRSLVASVRPQLLRMYAIEGWEPNRIVGCIEAAWLKELHMQILAIPNLPQSDPTWEGAAYNPHVSLAKTRDFDGYLPFVKEHIEIPFEWLATRIDIFVKPQGSKIYQEVDFFSLF